MSDKGKRNIGDFRMVGIKARIVQAIGLIFKGSIYLDSDHACSKDYLMYVGWEYCPYCGRLLKLGQKKRI